MISGPGDGRSFWELVVIAMIASPDWASREVRPADQINAVQA
jgi:hypothetical protein